MLIVKATFPSDHTLNKILCFSINIRRLKGGVGHSSMSSFDKSFIRQFEFMNAKVIKVSDAFIKYEIDEFDILLGKYSLEKTPSSSIINGVEYFNKSEISEWVKNSPSLKSARNIENYKKNKPTQKD